MLAYDGRKPEPPYGCMDCVDKDATIATLTAEREALAAALPSEGADAALFYAAMKTERNEWRQSCVACRQVNVELINERDALRRSNAHFDGEILRITVERDALRADLNQMHESSIRLVEEFNRFLLVIKEYDHGRTCP